MELSGLWRVAPLSPELHRSGADMDLDDSSWEQVAVPGHWAENPAFETFAGRLLYRRPFSYPMEPLPTEEKGAPTATPMKRQWLHFGGVMNSAEVWLDGEYIGDTENYSSRRRFDITRLLRDRPDHLLAVEVSCPYDGDGRDKTALTGTIQTGPLAPSRYPGGIWQPVTIQETGPVAIRHSRLICVAATTTQATIQIQLVLDSSRPDDVRIGTSVVAPTGDAVAGGMEHHTLASGENRLEWTITVDDPSLWWPASMGDQPLYEVAVAISTASPSPASQGGPAKGTVDGTADGAATGPVHAISDRGQWRIGLRTVEMDDLVFSINGKRLFSKSIAYGPPGPMLAHVPETTLWEDVRSVRDAGLDMMRIYGHVGRLETYAAADELGVLIWQDLPLIGGYSSKVKEAARSLARSTVSLLAHHPSIVVWSGHCEPNGQFLPEPITKPALDTSIIHRLKTSRYFLPTWNLSVLDTVVGRELRNADPSRPVIARSGNLPTPADLHGSDAHLWLGWHSGRPEQLAEVLRYWPRLAAFVGGIGTQSALVQDWSSDAPEWNTAETGSFARYIPRDAYPDGHSWAAATRAYQADVLRIQIETLRRLKYRPAGGFCVTALADAEPSGGFGVLDFERRPKPAFNALIDACRPVVVIADAPPHIVTPGTGLVLAVHAVNDLHSRLDHAKISAVARLNEWTHRVTWAGTLAADTCDKIGELAFVVPDQHGPLTIDLELESADLAVTNRYQTVVIPTAEG